MLHWNVPKKNRGFTLTELLVVSIIFGVLAAITVPQLLGLLYKARITEGLAMVEGAIKEAQSQSRRLSRNCSIEFGTTTVTRYGQVEQRATIERTAGADFTNCLIEDRVLPMDVIAVIGDGATNNSFPSATVPGTPLPITFSAKGNTTNNNTVKVYHPNTSIEDERCLVMNGIFGDISTGIHSDTDSDRSTIEVCNTN